MFAPVLRSTRTAPPSSKGGGNGGNGGGERGGDGAYASRHGCHRARLGAVLDLREAGHESSPGRAASAQRRAQRDWLFHSPSTGPLWLEKHNYRASLEK